MVLENPALSLNISVQDILDILEKTLKEKNWKHFELANLKLVYIPFYIFNYDLLIEEKVEEQTFSRGTSGVMAINAIDGKLEPLLTDIMEEQPVSYEKDISHDLQYEIKKPAIKEKELADTIKVKLAGQFGVGKDSVAPSGFRLVYWPVWIIFVTLPNKIQRVEVEAVSGYPLNFEEVPKREMGWMEVTADTLSKMKTAKGWKELAKKTVSITASGFKGAAGKEKKGKSGGLSYWFLHTKYGHWTLILTLLFILVMFFTYR